MVATVSRTSAIITTVFEPSAVSSRLATRQPKMATTLRMMPNMPISVIDQPNIAGRERAAERQQRVDAVLVDHARDEEAEDAAALAHFAERRFAVRTGPSRTAGPSGMPFAASGVKRNIGRMKTRYQQRRQRPGGARVLAELADRGRTAASMPMIVLPVSGRAGQAA